MTTHHLRNLCPGCGMKASVFRCRECEFRRGRNMWLALGGATAVVVIIAAAVRGWMQ